MKSGGWTCDLLEESVEMLGISSQRCIGKDSRGNYWLGASTDCLKNRKGLARGRILKL